MIPLKKMLPVVLVKMRGEEFRDRGYGHDRVVLTKQDLAHLLYGRVLCFEVAGGEYTCSIEVAEE
jgi:hypothetical protein